MTGTPSAVDLLAGLTEGEAVEARAAFGLLSGELGLDLGATFDRLQSGQPLSIALGLPPGTAALLYDRAYRLVIAGRMDRALPLFRVLCLIAPDEAKHWLGFGIAAFREGKVETARDALIRAIAQTPDWAIPHFHAADLYVRSQDWTRAAAELEAFDRASKADVPNRMLQEADRLRLAVDLARRRNANTGASATG